DLVPDIEQVEPVAGGARIPPEPLRERRPVGRGCSKTGEGKEEEQEKGENALRQHGIGTRFGGDILSARAAAVDRRRDAGPSLEGPEENRGLRGAELGGDLGDAGVALLEPREGDFAANAFLELAKARAFLVQAPVQRA